MENMATLDSNARSVFQTLDEANVAKTVLILAIELFFILVSTFLIQARNTIFFIY